MFEIDVDGCYGKRRLEEDDNVVVFTIFFVVKLVVLGCLFSTDWFIVFVVFIYCLLLFIVCLLIYGLNTFYCVIILVCVTLPVTSFLFRGGMYFVWLNILLLDI